MKPFKILFVFSFFLTVFSSVISLSCKSSQKAKSRNEPDLLTFSKIDKVSDKYTGRGVKIAVIDWQFDLSGEASKKYIDPVSVVPGREQRYSVI